MFDRSSNTLGFPSARGDPRVCPLPRPADSEVRKPSRLAAECGEIPGFFHKDLGIWVASIESGFWAQRLWSL